MDREIMAVTRQLRPLSDSGVRYLILHKRLASSERLDSWREWLTFKPFYQDDELLVYRTDPKLERDFDINHGYRTNVSQDIVHCIALASKFPRSQSSRICGMCWNGKSNSLHLATYRT